MFVGSISFIDGLGWGDRSSNLLSRGFGCDYFRLVGSLLGCAARFIDGLGWSCSSFNNLIWLFNGFRCWDFFHFGILREMRFDLGFVQLLLHGNLRIITSCHWSILGGTLTSFFLRIPDNLFLFRSLLTCNKVVLDPFTEKLLLEGRLLLGFLHLASGSIVFDPGCQETLLERKLLGSGYQISSWFLGHDITWCSSFHERRWDLLAVHSLCWLVLGHGITWCSSIHKCRFDLFAFHSLRSCRLGFGIVLDSGCQKSLLEEIFFKLNCQSLGSLSEFDIIVNPGCQESLLEFVHVLSLLHATGEDFRLVGRSIVGRHCFLQRLDSFISRKHRLILLFFFVFFLL
mmetsp:Transcript_15319/g.37695  ORF Transcript_15319/g.37695 Transcript_15319/m.37695 type:complete len:343 (-) Transcript_15319:1952-2980(-)